MAIAAAMTSVLLKRCKPLWRLTTTRNLPGYLVVLASVMCDRHCSQCLVLLAEAVKQLLAEHKQKQCTGCLTLNLQLASTVSQAHR